MVKIRLTKYNCPDCVSGQIILMPYAGIHKCKTCKGTGKVKRFVRSPAYNRRIKNGDDFTGDAWIDMLKGRIVYCAVNYDINTGQRNTEIITNEH